MNKEIKIVEWFSGIGAASLALSNIGYEVNIIDSVEINKQSVLAFNSIHKTNFEPKDINTVDTSNYGEIDILIAGWPCQDISLAGNQAGLSGSRSSLIYTTITKIKQLKNKPKYILLENVKGLLSERNRIRFNDIKNEFKAMGYQWNQAMLNAKYFNVPQNRERVYMLLSRYDMKPVCIDKLENKNTVAITLRDILDFDLPCNFIDIITKTHTNFNEYLDIKKWTQKEAGSNKVYFKNEMKQYNNKMIELNLTNLKQQTRDKINKVASLGELNRIVGFNKLPFKSDSNFNGVNGLSGTLLATGPDFKQKIIFNNGYKTFYYRKLAAKECLWLMGFKDQQTKQLFTLQKTLKNGTTKRAISDSAICKMAGNSIVVNVLEAIFKMIDKGSV